MLHCIGCMLYAKYRVARQTTSCLGAIARHRPPSTSAARSTAAATRQRATYTRHATRNGGEHRRVRHAACAHSHGVQRVSAHGALRAAQRTPVGRISLYIACRRVVPTLCGVVRCVDNTGCPRRSAPSRRTTTRRTTQTGSATPRRWPVARRRSKRRYVRPHLRRDSPTSAPGLTSLAIQLHTEMKFRAAEFEKYKFGAGVRGPHLPQDCAPSSTGPVAEHRVP
jgi:hypothetical protein